MLPLACLAPPSTPSTPRCAERGIACHPDRVEEFRKGVDQALALFDEVGSSNLKLQYDVYHMQIIRYAYPGGLGWLDAVCG